MTSEPLDPPTAAAPADSAPTPASPLPANRPDGASATRQDDQANPPKTKAARVFLRVRTAIWAALPARLRTIIAPDMIGFALLNGFTYSVDLTLLAVLANVLKWPYALSLTIAYGVAFSLAFLLNRTLNFRSSGAVAGEMSRYVLTVLVNYLAFILGLSSLLHWFGVGPVTARMTAGLCEAVFMYVMMRFVVFKSKSLLDIAADAVRTLRRR